LEYFLASQGIEYLVRAFPFPYRFVRYDIPVDGSNHRSKQFVNLPYQLTLVRHWIQLKREDRRQRLRLLETEPSIRGFFLHDFCISKIPEISEVVIIRFYALGNRRSSKVIKIVGLVLRAHKGI
jgi:hypothetical protein